MALLTACVSLCFGLKSRICSRSRQGLKNLRMNVILNKAKLVQSSSWKTSKEYVNMDVMDYRNYKRAWFPRLKLWQKMSLNKIPFILLATWGFQAAATPPHPPAPKHEQIPAQVPVGCISYLRWTPFIAIVSNYYSRNFPLNDLPTGATMVCCYC